MNAFKLLITRQQLQGIMMVLCIAMMLASPAGHAVDNFKFSGFASIGAGKLDSEEAQLMDYDSDWSFRSDTILGLQGQMDLSDRWSATLQVISRGYYSDDTSDFEPEVDWAFAKYKWTPATSIRIGLMKLPLYYYTDTIEVGYSYVWARPPVDVYFLAGISDYNGVDFTTNFDFNSFYLDLSVYAGVGASSGDFEDVEFEINKILGTTLTFQWDEFSIRYGATFANVDITAEFLNSFRETYQQFALLDPIFSDIANAHVVDSVLYQYHSLALRWDVSTWTLILEQYLINAPEDGFNIDISGGYASLSKQIGKFSPYIVASHFNQKVAGEIGGLVADSTAIIPSGFNPMIDLVRQSSLLLVDESSREGDSFALGLRYDFHSQMALKVELQHFGTLALFSSEDEGSLLIESDDIILTTIVLDVVF